MTAMIPLASRLVVRRAVLNQVWLTTRRFQHIVLIRQQFPVFPLHLHDEFGLWLADTRQLVAGGLVSWLAELLTPVEPLRAPSGTSGSGGSGPRRRNAKHLLPSELKQLMANHLDYVCHRTTNEAAGTCQEPVYGVTEQHLKKNPTAPDGVWAVGGIRGLQDYGGYLVIYPLRTGRRVWTSMGQPDYLCQVTQLDPDEAVGWCTQEDVDAARRL
ncbi:MAG: hypothetical protein ABIQ18_27455 [Umezawaea sp.]